MGPLQAWWARSRPGGSAPGPLQDLRSDFHTTFTLLPAVRKVPLTSGLLPGGGRLLLLDLLPPPPQRRV